MVRVVRRWNRLLRRWWSHHGWRSVWFWAPQYKRDTEIVWSICYIIRAWESWDCSGHRRDGSGGDLLNTQWERVKLQEPDSSSDHWLQAKCRQFHPNTRKCIFTMSVVKYRNSCTKRFWVLQMEIPLNQIENLVQMSIQACSWATWPSWPFLSREIGLKHLKKSFLTLTIL